MVKRTGRELAGDIVIAIVLLALGLGTAPFLPAWAPASRSVDPLGAILIATAAVGAGFRRWPVVSLAVAAVATSAYLLLGFPYGFVLLSVAVATYTVARRVRLPAAGIAAFAALLVLLGHLFTNPAALDGALGLLPGSAWIVVPFSLGVVRRLTVEAADRQRSDAERRALDDERLRLASEVHDIVGHGLAAIQMQADIALHIRDRKPGQAHEALEAISRTSAEALAELRATLASITPAEAGELDRLAPTPGFERIADLCDRMRESGIAVELAVIGRPHPVAPAVDVAAYRVVQESLTNVARHGDQRHATVTITHAPDTVTVEVGNPVSGDSRGAEGFGIGGMRRRVRDVGGTITVGVRAGRFVVSASFPRAVGS